MALLGEEHFHKGGDDRGLDQLARAAQGIERGEAKGRVGGQAARDEVARKHALRRRAQRASRQGAADVALRVAFLEAATKQAVDRRARDDAELAGGGDGAGEAPAGDGDAHAALDDDG